MLLAVVDPQSAMPELELVHVPLHAVTLPAPRSSTIVVRAAGADSVLLGSRANQ